MLHINPQEVLEKYRHEAFIDKVKHTPLIVHPQGKCCFSIRIAHMQCRFLLYVTIRVHLCAVGDCLQNVCITLYVYLRMILVLFNLLQIFSLN